MSKTKRNLIIIGSIVGMLVLLTILFGSLFSIKTITVDAATTFNRVEEYSEEEIKAVAKVQKGKNIVFAEFESTEERLEEAFPYAKFNIVRVFPSRVIIYVYERTPAFRVFKDGFWYIYDEDLKCLEIVANVNIGLNNNSEIPILSCEGLEINESVGQKLVNNDLQDKIRSIIDGVYGFEGTPLSVMSDIILEFDEILGTQVITLKIRETGTTIVVQGSNLVKEKIAYAVFVYASDVSQNINYNDRLDKVVITVYRNFTLSNKQVVVNDGTN